MGWGDSSLQGNKRIQSNEWSQPHMSRTSARTRRPQVLVQPGASYSLVGAKLLLQMRQYRLHTHILRQ